MRFGIAVMHIPHAWHVLNRALMPVAGSLIDIDDEAVAEVGEPGVCGDAE